MPRLLKQLTPEIGNQFYELLPHRYRMHDHSKVAPRGEEEKIGFHQRFVRIFGDYYDGKRRSYGELKNLLNPLKCPAAWLGHLSATLGFPLDPRIPEETARLLVDHLQSILRVAGTDQCIKKLCYALTGISVRIHTPNNAGTVMAQHATYLTEPYRSGDDHITVDDAGSIDIGHRITLANGTKRCRQIVTAVLGNNLYLKDDLLFTYAAGAMVIHGEPAQGGVPGVWGDKVAIAGQAIPGVQLAISGPRAWYCDPERGNTIYIEWHHFPNPELLDIVSDLVKELSPGQLHIHHISNDHTYFFAGLSIAGGREPAGS